MWFFSGLMYTIFIVMGITSGLTPLFGRQSTPFGVAITGKHEHIEKQKKKFATWNIIVSLLLGLPVFLIPMMEDPVKAEMTAAIFVLVGMIAFLLFTSILYLKFRNDVMKWKRSLPQDEQQKAKKVVIDMNYHEKVKTKSQLTFLIWQLAIITITVIIAFTFYDRIPEQIPIQFDYQFNVSQSIQKNVWGVLALPGIQVLMIPIFNYSNHAIVKSKQRLSPLDPIGASEKSRRFREAWSNLLFATTIGTQLLISFIFLYSMFSDGRATWLLVIVIVLFLVFSIGGPLYLTFKYGQAGEKLLEEEERYYVDSDDEAHWKFGVFYFNKEDPSIFLEKRFGIGSTMNYARWQTWVLVIGMILITILMTVWGIVLT